MDWTLTKLGEIFKLTSGKSKPLKQLQPYSSNNCYPVYGGNGINGYTNEILIEKNVLIVGRVGEYCGVVHFTNGPSWVTDNALYTKEFFIPCEMKFMYYLLVFHNLSKLKSKSSQPLVSQKPIHNYEVLLPTQAEQQKIAAILSSVDDAIDKTEQIIEQTERVKQGIMQQLLTRGIGHTEFKQTEIGEIPKEWSLLTLGECTISKPEYGSTASAQEYNENLPRYIRITDISSNGSLNYNDVKSVQLTGNEKYLLKENDVLFARTGNTVGKTYLHKKGDPSVFAGYLIRFRLDQNKILPDYLFHLTHSTYYYNWVLSVTRTGAQPNINAKEYSSFVLPLPPINDQRKIVSIIESIFHKAENERQKSLNLQRLKRGLMQQLLTGKVRIPMDENEVLSQ